MEKVNEIKNAIQQANNICLIPNNNEPESIVSALALFYTLKELNKNVNLIIDELPQKLNFLTPSIDFINTPKNFVISIPRSSADISQIYYEKNEHHLKIHLTIDKGRIKKENLAFYFEDAKPDLIITIGIQDFHQQLSERLNSFGFLLGSSILNIDNDFKNKKFGTINIVELGSLTEIILNAIRTIGWQISQNSANCLLSGLMIYYENFKSRKTSSDVFETAAELIKRGANNNQITENLYKTTDNEMNILGIIFQNMKTEDNTSLSLIENNQNIKNLREEDVRSLIDKLKTLGIKNNILVLWKNNISSIEGFFYSTTEDSIKKITEHYNIKSKNNLVWLSINNLDIYTVKEKIIALLKESKNNILEAQIAELKSS